MQDILNWINRTGLQNIVWATDLDKTVLDVSADPNAIIPVPGLEEACQRLDKICGGGFYVITGRDLNYVDRLVFPNASVRASAEYHCMARFDLRHEAEELVDRPRWDVIDSDLQAIVTPHMDWKLRIKPFMRSLHHHLPNASTEKAELFVALKQLIAKINAQTGQALEVIDGGPIFDMKPAGRDKDIALDNIMDFAQTRAGRGLVPVYFGDSPGDLPAARAAREHGGVFVSVGDDERVMAVADFKLASPAECRALTITASRLPIHAPARELKFP